MGENGLQTGAAVRYYVHYTVNLGPGAVHSPQKLVAGPYSAAEVIDMRREISKGRSVTDAYVSEDSK